MLFQRRHGMALLILIIAVIFMSTLNATNDLSHQKLSDAATREKRESAAVPGASSTVDKDGNIDLKVPGMEVETDKDGRTVIKEDGAPISDDKGGVEKIGYGIGLLVASVFAYLVIH